jgi:hypothetical protein
MITVAISDCDLYVDLFVGSVTVISVRVSTRDFIDRDLFIDLGVTLVTDLFIDLGMTSVTSLLTYDVSDC